MLLMMVEVNVSTICTHHQLRHNIMHTGSDIPLIVVCAILVVLM